MNEVFLGDIDISSRLTPNVVNLIYAPVGSGKSTWVKEKLINTVSDRREILYLTDTTAGRDQALNDEDSLTTYSKQWNRFMNDKLDGWGEWTNLPEDKVPIMTFSKMAHLIKANNDFGTGILKHIVLDECHNLKIYQSFSEDNTLRLLEHWLKRIYYNTDIIITALSATPRKINLMFPEHRLIDILSDDEKTKLRTLKSGRELKYLSIYNLLDNLPNGKIIIYTPHIQKIKEYAAIIKSKHKNNLKIDSIWSRNNEKHPLDDRQLAVWESILKSSEIPSETDVLLFNASCLTGVNIASRVDAVIIDDYDVDTQTQARGRIRSDINELYILSKEPDYFHIPSDFIGVPIYQDDKADVLKHMYIKNKAELTECLNKWTDGHIKGWNTISKMIKQSDDYCFGLTDNGKDYFRYRKYGSDYRYHIIQLKD